LLARAKEEHKKNIWLSVLNSNQRAIGFYIKNGFHEVGTHDFQIGKEGFEFIVMRKELE